MSAIEIMTRDEFLVRHEGNEFDISEFLKHHPGGFNYVESFRNKDIDNKMVNTEHSKSAFYLLREYKVGGREKKNAHGDNDLEELIDWNQPLLGQVGGLGSHYNAWVASPVDRCIRLFGNPILESLTITPWYVVPIVWLPIALYFTYHGWIHYSEFTKNRFPIFPVILALISGFVIWTLIEYSLHRWVFHMEPSGKSKTFIYIHFAIHGLHHKAPFDNQRLVFPVFPAAAVVYLIYRILDIVFPQHTVLLILSGGIIGYVSYDMIHFYLHNGFPVENSILYNMKRYHNQHHFVHHNSGFGISSLYWDKVFGTTIRLKKLAIGIKWCRDKLKR